MQKIDPAYLYHIGAQLRALARLTPDTDWFDSSAIFVNAKEAVAAAISPQNLYYPSLHQSPTRGEALWVVLHKMIARMGSAEWYGYFEQAEVNELLDALVGFESVYLTELQNASVFYVEPKGGFDLDHLINGGKALFPDSLILKVPETEFDVREGARALAFQLWTGSGYHFHRANEIVLRAYADHCAPGLRRSKSTMGMIVRKMKEKGVGDAPILAALENLIQFHRNPLIHPHQSIETKDEAISLYAAIRASMGYMLDKLPQP
ncbi:MAG: hypothetical protein JO276_00650, partial [Sphingomonadaceae bacterium]|nr:hypothetical protein [Sphingomonadaceae bacterium]